MTEYLVYTEDGGPHYRFNNWTQARSHALRMSRQHKKECAIAKVETTAAGRTYWCDSCHASKVEVFK